MPKILIIDDDADFLKELDEMLAGHGFDVALLTDTTRAIEVVDAVNPDLVLLDILMPDKSGFGVANDIRRFCKNVNVPIITMSGLVQARGVVPLNKVCGVQRYIQKPFKPETLISEVRELLIEGAQTKKTVAA